jgi:glyoxylase-like metal-dependent hydrolase (beta-lactamase superfamily II)
MLNWQVGAVKITSVVEMLMSLPYDPESFFLRDATPQALTASPWLYPHFANEDGSLNVSVQALLVEAPGLRLMVDTCIGNDKPRRLVGGNPLATPFLQHLAEAGWSRDDVDAVVCTHLHVDHVGWNTMLVDGKWVRRDDGPTRHGSCFQLTRRTTSPAGRTRRPAGWIWAGGIEVESDGCVS